MADEARLHSLLDLVEQARKEGDTVTEQKAAAAYKAASAPAPYVNKLDTPGKFLTAALDQGKRLGLLTAKGVNDSVVGTATLPANALTQAINLASGRNDQTLGQRYQQSSDASVAPATNAVEQAFQTGGGFLAGAKMPLPGGGSAAGIPSPTQVSNVMARGADYVLPPSSIQNAGGLTRAIGKFAGTKATNAAATVQNKAQTVANIGKEFGLPEGTDITPDVMDAISAHAWESGYKPVEDLGPQYASIVDVIRKARETTKKLFTDYSRTGRSESLDKAREAQTAATNAEKVLEGALQQAGKPELLSGYKTARSTIAKASAVDRQLIESTGTIKEAGLAREFGKSAPQSGALLQAGRVAQQSPAAFSTAAPPAGLDMATRAAGLGSVAGLGGSAILHNPAYAEIGLGILGGKLGVDVLRAGARKMLLSPAVQDAMTFMTPEQKRMAMASAVLRGGASMPLSQDQEQQ
jgi:hypothetical protein